MKIFSAQQIKNWDSYTIQHEPITSIDLMERAANACAKWIAKKFSAKDIAVFCGQGNNGGDGLAIARILKTEGFNVAVFVLKIQEFGSNDFEVNLKRLESLIQINYITSEISFPSLSNNMVIVDALYGTGLNRPLNGLPVALVKYINLLINIKISIDIPSGLFVDKSSLSNEIIKATYTLSFQCSKLAFLMPENESYVGECKILDISLNDKYEQQTDTPFVLLEKEYIQALIKPRRKFAYKNQFGHAMIYAGSTGMMGAAILCGRATLKTGVGLVSYYLDDSTMLPVLQASVPEAMCNININIEKLYARKTAVGIGPGLRIGEVQKKLCYDVFKYYLGPMVIDASALNFLPSFLQEHQLPVNTIITPHIGEFDKCFGGSNNDFDRLKLAQDKANELNIFIILKGAYTAIVTPGKKVYFNSTGNAGMAKGGSGDVLTGILTGLLAQGYLPLDACLLGVYLHGLAGDAAANALTQYAMTASDIIDHLNLAWKNLLSE